MFCAVINCNMCSRKKENKHYYIGFHAFPKCPIVLKQWIQFCGRKDKFNVKTARICSRHFIEEDYENNLQFKMGFSQHRIIKSGAVPSINHNQNVDDSSMLKNANRTKRVQDKCTKKKLNVLSEESCDTNTEEHFDLIDNHKYVQTESTYLNILEEEIENLKNENKVLKENVSKNQTKIEELNILLEKRYFEKKNMDKKLSKIFTSGQLVKLKQPHCVKLNRKEANITQSISLYGPNRTRAKKKKR